MAKKEKGYENRVVAFVDILAFKDKIKKTVDANGEPIQLEVDSIIEAYESIRGVWELDLGKHSPEMRAIIKKGKTKSKIITMFSDCIVISFLENEESEIFSTLLELKWMIMKLISHGFLCRGALTYGKLFHTNQMIFGPALIEAYEIESKAALYPRIILSKELIEIAGRNHSKHSHSSHSEMEYVRALLKEDTDGMYYIDYFLGAQSELDDPENDFPSYIEMVSEVVKSGITSTKPEIRIKYKWMQKKINNVIKMGRKEEWLETLRKKGNDELADAYESLDEI